VLAGLKARARALGAGGGSGVALTAAAGSDEQREIIDGIRAGSYTLVYVAPERFRSPRFIDALNAIAGRLALVAIDEAHCISEWGHDFRPDYRRLGQVIAALQPPRLAAFTATATPEVRRDIGVQLGIEGARLHVRGFDRPNLYFTVQKVGGAADKTARMIDLVRMREGGVALVYAATRKNAEAYSVALRQAGMRSRVYHAGLEDNVRNKAQDVFMAGELDVIVATNAFGMGVDKSDIRLVVHADIPRSPEAYYQEAGRGGRDGKPTRCVLLFNHGDIRLQEFLIEASFPSAELLRGLWKLLADQPALGRLRGRDDDTGDLEARLKPLLPVSTTGAGAPSPATISAAIRILEKHGMLVRDDERLAAQRPQPGVYAPLDVQSLQRRADIERGKLRMMIDFAYYPRCRRQYMLDYFGDLDWKSRDRRCGACDNCDALAHGQPTGLSESDIKAVRSLLMLVGSLNGKFGRTRVAAIANGSDDDSRFDEMPERGALRGWTQAAIMDLLRSCEGAGLVEASRGEYPTITTTRKGDQVGIGTVKLDDLGLQMPTNTKKKKKPFFAAKRTR